MQKKKQEIILGVIFLLIMVFFGLNSELFSARIDVTANKIFTITSVSQNLFKEIPEQVNITFYLTEKLKATNAIYRQIEDILREYAAYSNGRIMLAIVDPIRDERTQETQEFGLIDFESGTQDSPDQANIFLAYSGIVIQYLDRTRVLPLVQGTDTLEYDLTTNIRQLITNKIKKTAFIVDKADFDLNGFATITNWMEQYFDVEMLQKGQEIPSGITSLVVIGGMGLSEVDLYPIDQFIMNGGRVLFFTDAVMINFQYGMAIPNPSAPLFSMLTNYGVTVEPGLIMENPQLSIPVSRPYNYFFSTFQDFVSKENPITAHFKPVYLFGASPLTLAAPAGVTAEKLINTSPYAVMVQEQIPVDPSQVSATYSMMAGSAAAEQTAVAVLSGTFPGFFKDRPIPPQDDPSGESSLESALGDQEQTGDDQSIVDPQQQKTVTSSSPTRIIVVGDSDMMGPDYLQYTQYVNLTFFINCVEWLSNDEDLLSIRTRAQADLYMGKIQDAEQKKGAENAIIFINLIGVPLIVVVFGIINFLIRRKRKDATKTQKHEAV